MDKCFTCKKKMNEGSNLEIPCIKFKFLEGSPIICELCLFRHLGYQGIWKEEIEKDLTHD